MKQITDDILIKALELLEAGQTPEQIFAVFPSAQKELEEYFKLTMDLRSEADKIAPPSREVLRGALRRAAAMQDITALSVKPASARFFSRMPFGLRVLAPVLVMLVIVVFSDRAQVTAPGGPASNNQAAVPESIETMSAAPSDSQAAFMAKAPAANQPPSPVAPASMAMKTASAPEASTPSSEADKIAQTSIADAEAEQAAYSDTSAEEQAAQSNDAQYIAEPTN